MAACKHFFQKLVFVVELFVLSFGCFSILSCKNMLAENDYLKVLDEAITYISSEPFTIRFSDEGGKIFPSGDYSVKVTDQISLLFTPEASKFFQKWEVYLNDELLEDEEAAKYLSFEDITKPETKVKILQKVDNLKIQAKMVLRPSVVFTNPQNGDNNIVRNRDINIIFSKPIKEEMLKKCVRVYEGAQYFTGQDIFYEKKDITSMLDFVLSKEKTTLTIKLKPGNYYNAVKYISVEIDKSLASSLDNSSMEKDFEMQFMTNSYKDSLAPKIADFYCGFGDEYKDSNIIVKQQNETDFIINENSKVENYFVNDKAVFIKSSDNQNFNFYIQAFDLEGVVDNTNGILDEHSVNNILYRYTKYNIHRDGTLYAGAVSENQILPYRSGNFSDDSMKGNKSFADITGLQNGKTGCVATISFNDLQDGLYRYDFTTQDFNNNNGFNETGWEKHDNGYKSIFIVKNTQKPKIDSLCFYTYLAHYNNPASPYTFGNKSPLIGPTYDKDVLCIKFSNAYVGIKKIKLDVKYNDGTVISNPIQNAQVYCSSTDNSIESQLTNPLTVKPNGNEVEITDYFENCLPSGYIFIKGLDLRDPNLKTMGSKSLTVTVTLTDIFGNEQEEKASINATYKHTILG